ncbi:AAA family ATPase [Nocardioides immobilis]|uniref:AAA family ATPase n=1 Tax=Nocardioides immobilis TaxID=2049295 RepID=UPI0015F96BB5|nr:LuxR family transcriptional regulator [Nocardioides immobilis]
MAIEEILERDDELAVLRAAVDRLVAGRGGVVLVEGAAGTGRTTLLEAAVADIPAMLLVARGGVMESGEAFGGVRQLLLPMLRRLPADERVAVLGGPARLAARILGFGEDIVDESAPDPFFSVRWLLEELAAGQPLVLAVDDLHWLDEESRRVLTRLATRLEGLPVLLLATARPAEPGATTDLTELRGVADVVKLAALSESAVERLLPGRDPADAHRVTGGNPRLLRQLAAVPTDVPLADARLQGEGARVLVRARRISPAAEQVVRTVALFPDGAPLETVACVAGVTPSEVADDVDALLASDLLAGNDVLCFAAPVLRRAVHDELGAFARREAHAEAAQMLRKQGAPVEAVASQLLLASPRGDAEAVRVLREAANQVPGPIARLRYLERALAEPPVPGPDRVDLLIDVGRLRGRLGRADACDALRQAYDDAQDPGRRAEAGVHLAALLHGAGRHDEGLLVVLELGLLPADGVDPEHRQLALALTLGLALETGRHDVARDALATLGPSLEPRTPGERAAQEMRGFFAWGESPGGELALDGSDPDGLPAAFAEYGIVTFDGSNSLCLAGEFDRLERLVEARLRVARERVDEQAHLVAVAGRAHGRALRGHWRLAEADALEVVGHPAAGNDVVVTSVELLAQCYARQLRIEEAEAAAGRLLELGASPFRAEIARAIIAGVVGDPTPQPVFEQIIRSYLEAGLTHPALRRWTCEHAESLARGGRRDEAVAVLTDYLDEAERYGEAASIGQAATVLGRLVGGDAGLALLERAVEVLGPSPHEWLRGWAHARLGEARRRAGHRADARPLLHAALAYADEHGEELLARTAREELRLAGGRNREAAARRPDDLTPAEARVARLAAEGLSNKEVAAALFLTVGSVQTTLVRVFRKLEVGSRQLLPEALAARGITVGTSSRSR